LALTDGTAAVEKSFGETIMNLFDAVLAGYMLGVCITGLLLLWNFRSWDKK